MRASRASSASSRTRSRPPSTWMKCRATCASCAGGSRSSSTATRRWRSSSAICTPIWTSAWRQPAGRQPAPRRRAGAAAGAAAGGASGETAAVGGAATPGAAAGAAAGNAPSSVEQAVYSQAFDALKAGSYSVAITGFKDFLGTYPASALAENAQYWLGEAYYVNHDYEAAAGAFRAVLKKWPDSRKAPDALLKLGY